MNKNWLIFASLVIGYCWYKYNERRKKILSEFPGLLSKKPDDLDMLELFKYNTDKSDKKFFSSIALVALVIGIWGGIWSPYQSNRESKQQVDAYIVAFQKGWNEYCDETFDYSMGSLSPNGILYAGSNSFNGGWCKGLMTSGAAEQQAEIDDVAGMAPYSDVDYASRKGESVGYRKSLEKVFSVVPYLCYGTECISKDSEENRIIDSNLQDLRAEQGMDFYG